MNQENVWNRILWVFVGSALVVNILLLIQIETVVSVIGVLVSLSLILIVVFIIISLTKYRNVNYFEIEEEKPLT